MAKTDDSAYPDVCLDAMAKRLADAEAAAPTWCIYDDTVLVAARADALAMEDRPWEKSPRA